jgi:hypothetical protein
MTELREVWISTLVPVKVLNALKEYLGEESQVLAHHVGRDRTCVEVDPQVEMDVRSWFKSRDYTFLR